MEAASRDSRTDDTDLTKIARFQRAAQLRRYLVLLSAALGLLVLVLLSAIAVTAIVDAVSIWLPLLCNLAAMLLLLWASLREAWRICNWRALALSQVEVAPSEAPPSEDIAARPNVIDQIWIRADAYWRAIVNQIGSSAIVLASLSSIGLLLVYLGSRVDVAPQPVGRPGLTVAAIALLAAFGLLVVERHVLVIVRAQWPEAENLAMQMRMSIACLIATALCLFFANSDAIWPLRVAAAIAALPGLTALELFLRAVLSVFKPRSDALEPSFISCSFIATLFRWPPTPLRTIQGELQAQFGIDLRQTWAFGFVRRASIPVLIFIAMIAWCVSAVREVPIDGRGIYERFGSPISILQPGLHVGLPWPFGRVVPVENGAVHELATGTDSGQPDVPVSADGPAPDSANRLWDATHQSENSQLISDFSNGKQSFQVLNMDVRLIYRIGLSDHSALAATYNTSDIPTLIRSLANHVLVHDFSSRSLDELLSERRQLLALEISMRLQRDLDAADSGVEILDTLIEAIHPPAGAADAYHGVQAAQITAQALVARVRGNAAESLNQAQLQATVLADRASALAREETSNATATQLRFDAERQAWQTAGQAFLNERYFTQLARGLSTTQTLILDHRIAPNDLPTLDFRRFAPGTIPSAPVVDSDQRKTVP
jgi:regulator of protease activity HflC (stomatin/prohibitin superfamily)